MEFKGVEVSRGATLPKSGFVMAKKGKFGCRMLPTH